MCAEAAALCGSNLDLVGTGVTGHIRSFVRPVLFATAVNVIAMLTRAHAERRAR